MGLHCIYALSEAHVKPLRQHMLTNFNKICERKGVRKKKREIMEYIERGTEGIVV